MEATEQLATVRVHVRWMIKRDWEEVCRIEGDHPPRPWSGDVFLNHLRQRDIIGMVAETGDQVVGFMVFQLDAKALTILNMAVAPDWQRRGVGSQCIRKMLDKLSSHRRTALLVTVRESNLAAQLFFKGAGFVAEDVLRDEFEDEDGYLMAFRIPEADHAKS